MKLSVIVPALNEETNVHPTLSALRETARGRPFELLVVDGGSTDETVARTKRWADQVLQASRGRALQMHRGALAAAGDILLFLHADTRLPEGWFESLERVWNGGKPPAAAAFRLALDAQGWRYRLIERASAFRARLTGVPLGDQAISVRRELYFSVGGFPNVPLMEEYYLLRKLRNHGRVELIDRPVLTSARRHQRNGPIRQGLRNNLITALFLCGMAPERLARLYR